MVISEGIEDGKGPEGGCKSADNVPFLSLADGHKVVFTLCEFISNMLWLEPINFNKL